jgi:hypothetical protein
MPFATLGSWVTVALFPSFSRPDAASVASGHVLGR